MRLTLAPAQQVRVSRASHYQQRLSEENRESKDLQLKNSVLDGGTLYFSTPTGFRLRANSKAVIENHHCGGQTVSVQTNSLGHRGPELGEKTRPRVLFIGDSITVQDYLNSEETWIRRVEQISRERGVPIDAVNAGVGAIGMANELAILQETGLSVEPDVVVLGWYLNDFQSSPGVQILDVPWYARKLRLGQLIFSALTFYYPERFRTQEQVLSSELLRGWLQETRKQFPAAEGDRKKDRNALHALIHDQFYDWGMAWSDSAWNYLRPQFAEFARRTRMKGAEPMIIIFPVLPQIEAEYVANYPQQQVQAIADELNISVLDLLPTMRKAYREHQHELLYYDQCHPTAFGSSIAAKVIYEFLAQHADGLG